MPASSRDARTFGNRVLRECGSRAYVKDIKLLRKLSGWKLGLNCGIARGDAKGEVPGASIFFQIVNVSNPEISATINLRLVALLQ
jgi:hypothetical protein